MRVARRRELSRKPKLLARGTTIGHAKLDRFAPAAVRRVRLVVEEAVAPPEPVAVRLYAGG